MKLVDKKLYADEGKVLDFAEPKYALDDEHVKTQVHLYTKFIRLGIMDKPENYIEVDESEVK